MSGNDESRTWVFARGSLSAAQIQKTVDEVLAGTLSSPPGHDDSGQAVLDLTALEDGPIDLGRTVTVRPGEPGTDEVLVEIGPGLSVKFAWDLWSTKIQPRLNRTAADAIGPRRGTRQRGR